jgi:hypothetical protein
MGRAKDVLNAKQIQNARPKEKEKEFKLADGGGIYLMVEPSGTKIWLFNYYRPYTRKRANLIMDKYPDLGLSNARDRRTAYANLLANNIDPQEHEREQNQAHQQKHAANLERVALIG